MDCPFSILERENESNLPRRLCRPYTTVGNQRLTVTPHSIPHQPATSDVLIALNPQHADLLRWALHHRIGSNYQAFGHLAKHRPAPPTLGNHIPGQYRAALKTLHRKYLPNFGDVQDRGGTITQAAA